MAYRMTELSENVRAGKMSDGTLNIEVWAVPRGWEPHVDCQRDPDEIFLPADAVSALFEYLR